MPYIVNELGLYIAFPAGHFHESERCEIIEESVEGKRTKSHRGSLFSSVETAVLLVSKSPVLQQPMFSHLIGKVYKQTTYACSHNRRHVHVAT